MCIYVSLYIYIYIYTIDIDIEIEIDIDTGSALLGIHYRGVQWEGGAVDGGSITS